MPSAHAAWQRLRERAALSIGLLAWRRSAAPSGLDTSDPR